MKERDLPVELHGSPPPYDVFKLRATVYGQGMASHCGAHKFGTWAASIATAAIRLLRGG